MQREAEKYDTSMYAVVKLPPEKVEELCAGHQNVYPVNYNCPGQISVSGLSQEMPALCNEVKEAGGRAIPIKVKGAFHSPFMKSAAEDFYKELQKADIKDMSIPLYSDMTALRYSQNAAELLSRQICSPVKWESLIRNMIADGIDTFIEIGPGRTLTNMIKKIDAQVKAYSLNEYFAEVE